MFVFEFASFFIHSLWFFIHMIYFIPSIRIKTKRSEQKSNVGEGKANTQAATTDCVVWRWTVFARLFFVLPFVDFIFTFRSIESKNQVQFN